jgi:hypothetical protein
MTDDRRKGRVRMEYDRGGKRGKTYRKTLIHCMVKCLNKCRQPQKKEDKKKTEMRPALSRYTDGRRGRKRCVCAFTPAQAETSCLWMGSKKGKIELSVCIHQHQQRQQRRDGVAVC